MLGKLTFSNGPQVMGKRFMANLHASLDSTWKGRFFQISTRCQLWGVHCTTFDPELRNEVKNLSNLGGVHSTTFHLELRNERFTLISFMGFPAILSTLQPFQICIFNRKQSKLTFSNDPQVMGKRFMANLHASLDSTWKSRFFQISTRCQLWVGTFNNF